jgi:mono/diheme cytochrome c family protein
MRKIMSKSIYHSIFTGLVVGSLLGVSMVSHADSDKEKQAKTSAAKPTKTAATPAPAATTTAMIEGRRTYLRANCYGCHGMFATGGMGPNIVHAESGDIQEAVHGGEEGGMPGYSSKLISATDANNLAAYLQSIGSASEPKFMRWWESGVPSQ